MTRTKLIMSTEMNLPLDGPDEKLIALLSGLLVPNVHVWLQQEPEVLNMLGATLAMKICGEPQEVIDAHQIKMQSLMVIDQSTIDELVLPTESKIILQ